MAKVYVSMTDTFMSGWGRAENKINKLIFECDSEEEAQIVQQNATNRSDQEEIMITTCIPDFRGDEFLVQHKDKLEYPHWYKKGQF